MAKVWITKKPSVASWQRPRSGEPDEVSGNGNFLAVVTEEVSAATWNEQEGKLTVGSGKAVLLSSGNDSKAERFGPDQDVYNYLQEAIPVGTNPEQFVWLEESQADGRLYVAAGVSGRSLYKFVLTEDMGATTAGEAAGTVSDPDGSDSKSATLKDHPAGIFQVLTSGREGWALKLSDDYWIIQANCPPPDYVEDTGDGPLSGDGTYVHGGA